MPTCARICKYVALLVAVIASLDGSVAVAGIAGGDGLPVSSRPATADATVSRDRPRTRLGRKSSLEARRGHSYSVVRFGADPPGTITNARLRLYLVKGQAADLLVYATRPKSWQESRVAFRTAPRLTGAPARALASQGRWVEFDVTPLVKAQEGATLALRSRRGRVVLRSREAKGRGPQLVERREGAAPAPVIMAAGDISCDPNYGKFNGGAGTERECAQRRTSDIFVTSPPDAVLALGDTQYDDGRLSAFRTAWAPSWGRAGQLLRPAVGNHEYGTANAAGYFDYFNGVGKATGPAGRRSEGWYSFDIGRWHIVALNSNCFRVSCKAGSPQETFLRRDLAAHRNRCTLAFWHHSLFTSGQQGKFTDQRLATRPLYAALYAAGAEIVLTGHDHDYERFAPLDPFGRPSARGVRQWVVGTGGESLAPFEAVQPGSEVRNNDSFGVLRLALRPDGYDWKFLPAAGSTFTDTGSAPCH